MQHKIKVIRTSTIPLSLDVLLKGQLAYLNQFYNIKAISGKGKHLENVAEREKVEVIPIKMARKISPILDIIALFKLYKTFKKEKPTIVHSITPKAGLLSMVAARLAGVPIRMHSFTGLIFPHKSGFIQKVLIWMDRLLCYSATHIYPEGKGVKKDLIKFKITNKPLKVIGHGNINGIDINYFNENSISKENINSLIEKYQICSKDYKFIYIGRITRDKGINELIKAFESLYAQNSLIKLLLVGDFDNEVGIDDEISELIKTHPAIIHTGWQDDVRPFLKLSDCFVFPSYREGFPNVVLQAGAMGVPSIVTDISGSNEIIKHNKNGLIVPVKDVSALKKAMKEMLNKDIGKMKVESRTRVAKYYNQSDLWENIHQEYEKNLSAIKKPKLVRITTVPISMDKLLEGQLKYMSSDFDVVAISSNGNGYLEQVAEREGVNFKPIHLTRSITPFKDLKSLYQLYKFLKREKPTIVHTHTPKAGTIGMWAAKLAGVPIRLHTVAGLPLMERYGFKRKLLMFIEKLTYKYATTVLPNSKGLKDFIIEQNLTKKEKLHIIGNGSTNGINVEYFNPELYSDSFKKNFKNYIGINENDFIYVFIGRLVKDKGIEELIEAFKLLDNKNCKLLLVGSQEKELDPLSIKTTKEINSNPNIIETGWQEDVRPYYAISDALVFPSYREGFPNVVLQAGAMGLPSIVSDINGCNEIITHSKNGIIVKPKDVLELHQAMNEISKNNIIRKEMAECARKHILSNYKRDFILKKIKELYFSSIENVNNTKY